MGTQQPDLPGYEEIIGSLASKLDGLSTVHRGLGEAADSLILAHYELDESKRRIEKLTDSAQAMVAEVQRLQPAELAATLDASLDSLSRDVLESVNALNQRMLETAREVTTARARTDAGLALIEREIAGQNESISMNLSRLENSFASSLDESQTTVVDSLTQTHHVTQDGLQKIHAAMVIVYDRQDAHWQAVVDIQRRIEELARRQDELFPSLAELNRMEAEHGQQIASLLEASVRTRQVAETTLSTLIATRQVAQGIEPAIETSLRESRNELVSAVAQAKKTQLASLVLILFAVAIVWAAQAGILPSP